MYLILVNHSIRVISIYFVFDVICGVCLRNGYVTVEFESPSLINVSVAYMSSLPNALKFFKCDTDHRFSTTCHQNLNQQ